MTDHIIVVALSLQLGMTPEQVSELLWTRIGLEVPASAISVRDSGIYAANAFIRITAESMAGLLNRNFSDCVLDGQREAVHFAPKIWKSELNRLGIRRC
jgi:hypothetical protein